MKMTYRYLWLVFCALCAALLLAGCSSVAEDSQLEQSVSQSVSQSEVESEPVAEVPDPLLKYFEEATDCIGKEDYEGAVKIYTSGLEADPQRADLYLSRAQAYLAYRAVGDAMTDLKQVIELDPDCVEAYMLLVEYNLDFTRIPEETLHWMGRIAELAPEYVIDSTTDSGQSRTFLRLDGSKFVELQYAADGSMVYAARFNDDELLTVEMEYVIEGKSGEMLEKRFDATGDVSTQTVYQRNDTGIIISEVTYKMPDNAVSSRREYNEQGNMILEETGMLNGNPYLQISEYNDEGMMSKSDAYLNGQLVAHYEYAFPYKYSKVMQYYNGECYINVEGEYDAEGNCTKVIWYDEHGNITSISESTGADTYTITYYENGVAGETYERSGKLEVQIEK